MAWLVSIIGVGGGELRIICTCLKTVKSKDN